MIQSIFLKLVLAPLMLCVPFFASAYETRTHAWIGEQAFLKILGSPFAIEVTAFDAKGIYSADISVDGECNDAADTGRQMLEGMIEEDDYCAFRSRTLSWEASQRPLQHFWFPDTSYEDGLLGYLSALEKAQLLWDQARQLYFGGETNLAYWYLGRVAHLLQDMASPAHTHLDQHYDGFPFPSSNEDANEKWNDQTNGMTLRPNHELLSASHPNTSIPDPATLPTPPYLASIPPHFDPQLVSLFYSMATEARKFDSDDSGHCDVVESTVEKGIHNEFATKAILQDLAGQHPVVKWYRQTSDGNLAGITPVLLTLGTDYEFDDYWGNTREDRLYLYANIDDFDEEDAFETIYDVLQVTYGTVVTNISEFEYAFAPNCDGHLFARFASVPTSVLLRNQQTLLAKAIGHTAALYQLFWKRTHVFPRATFFGYASGGHAGGSGMNRLRGGKGGSVDIRTGLCKEEINLGDGSDQDLTSAAQLKVGLSPGTYHYRQVKPAPGRPLELEIDGEVTIHCQYVFRPMNIRRAPDSTRRPVLKVYAGSALEWVPATGGGERLQETLHNGFVNFDPLVASNGTEGEEGGEFLFWTTQPSDLFFFADVSGGAGYRGGRGGNGGTIVLVANGSGLTGTASANGGFPGDVSWGENAGDGGDAGSIVMGPSRPYSHSFIPNAISAIANGGDGGWGGTGAVGGTPGGRGGNGGAGGAIRFQLLPPAYPMNCRFESITAVGGAGGKGGTGGEGTPGTGGSTTGTSGGDGGNGGLGGIGGDAGGPGVIEGYIHTLTNRYAVAVPHQWHGGRGGDGGAGGSGGRGGDGGTGFSGGDGGDGGDGNTGGNSASDSGVLAAGGAPGSGGGGGFGQPRGASGNPGERGGDGSNSHLAPPPGAAEIVVATCRATVDSSEDGEFREPEFFEDKLHLGLKTLAGKSEYLLQTSTNLVTWHTVTNVMATNTVIQFKDTVGTNRTQRFYRAIAR